LYSLTPAVGKTHQLHRAGFETAGRIEGAVAA
jgi:hypothetical protein